MKSPLWQEMIEASDDLLRERCAELADPDAAIAATHLKIIYAWLLTVRPQHVLDLLDREILIANAAADGRVTDCDYSPETLAGSPMVPPSDGAAKAPSDLLLNSNNEQPHN